MGNYNNFDAAIAAGKKGEALAANYLIDLGYFIEDVSSNKEYQAKDIDFIATKQNERLLVEVKADSRIHETNNICIETISNKTSGKIGWFFSSAASHFFFCDVVQGKIHCVRAEELRELYNDNSFKHIETRQYECGTFLKYGEVCIIPLSKLCVLPHYRLLEKS